MRDRWKLLFHSSSVSKSAARCYSTLVLIGILLVFASSAKAQVGPIPFVVPQYFNNSGQPCSGCKLNTYVSGSTTPQQTFTDYTGITANTNPIVMGSNGRPTNASGAAVSIFLSSAAYRFVLTNAAASITYFTIDGITASNVSLLASNNIWTGTNTFQAASTFNGSVQLNVGFTSLGPNVLGGGGAISGTWSGSPVFSGTPNFSAGFLSTTGSFSGQITSTVATGTAPFVISSTTAVPNLNASLLLGCTWAVPCTIGSTTPNTGAFTTLSAATSFTLAGGTPQTSMQGTDVKLFTAGTVSGTAKPLCTDALGGATTSGCPTAPPIMQDVTVCPVGCTITATPCTTSGAGSAGCVSGPYTWPVAFVDSKYSLVCQGITYTGFPYIQDAVKTATTFSVNIFNGTASSAVASTYAEIDCHASHN